jgi:hypothetical protein
MSLLIDWSSWAFSSIDGLSHSRSIHGEINTTASGNGRSILSISPMAQTTRLPPALSPMRLIRCGADNLQQSVLHFGKPCFRDHSKIPVELWICSEKINKVRSADLENGRRFDRFDIYLAFGLGIKAVDEHDPVIFRSKLQVVFHAAAPRCQRGRFHLQIHFFVYLSQLLREGSVSIQHS